MTERKKGQSMRLYKGAGVCALIAALLWPIAFVLQSSFAENMINVALLRGEDLSMVIKELFDLLNDTEMSLFYNLPHLPGMLILVPFLVVFAVVCLRATDRKKGKRDSCKIIGIGLESYAAVAFFVHILMAIALYYTEWSLGASHRVILRILFTAFGSGFAELAMISLFAVSLLITGRTCANRPLAVAAGAICFFRLFEDSLWLFTGMFDRTLPSVPGAQIAHGILFLVAMSLTFGGAVLVAMSSPKDEEGEEGGTA